MDFSDEKFKILIDFFKKSFVEHWEDEKYKWQAVKHFQDNWNIDADNFSAMFDKATKKADNLLLSANYFPRGMILEFSKENPEKTRQMFELLFDENKTLSGRIEQFKNIADELQATHNQNSSSKWKSHFQTDNAISTYLWLRFPKQYYIYKWSECRNVARELDCPVKFTKGHKDNLENGFAFYDSICEELEKDSELKNLLKSKLTNDCYSDEALKTLTIDFGFHVSRYYNEGITISKEQWQKLVVDPDVFTENSLLTFACIRKAKIPTCSDIAEEFGRNKEFYNVNGWQVGKKVIEKLKITPPKDQDGKTWFWSITCFVEELENGRYSFEIRSELDKAFEETGILNNIELYEKGAVEMSDILNEYKNLLLNTHNLILHGAPGTGKTHLAKDIAKSMGAEWEMVQFHPSYDYTDFVEGLRPVNGENGQIGFERKDGVFKKFCEKALLSNSADSDMLKELNDNPTVWKVSLEGTGDNPTRADCMENGYIRIGWCDYGDVPDFSNFREFKDGGSVVLVAFQSKMKIGDIVLSCWSATEIDAIGIVTGDYEYRSEGGDYPRYRTVKWLVKGIRENIVEKNHGKTLTLASVYRLSISIQDVMEIVNKYNQSISIQTPDNAIDQFIRVMDGKEIPSSRGESFFPIVIKDNKIFVKAKTGTENPISRTIIKQCIEGIEPDNGHTYEASIGHYIKTNMQKKMKSYVFIIDEINRGEMSKIFGELFFSIDPGYRGKKGLIKTQYQNLIQENNIFYDGFYVPDNVYIIGTMNDIDRSVESMDFAFRRRFTFCEVKANENLGMLDELDESIREKAKLTLLSLNNAIWNKETKTGIDGLSSAYHIGGAYFLKLKELNNDFGKLWEYHLEGLLREYLRGMEDAEETLKNLKSAYHNPNKLSENLSDEQQEA